MDKFKKARSFHQNGYFNEAREIYNELKNDNFQCRPDINFYLGLVEQELGNTKEAIIFLKSSIESERTIEAHYNLGVNYTAIGDIMKGVSEFKNVLELDEKNVKMLFNIGVLCDKIYEYNMAIASFQEILNCDSTCVEARQRLAYTCSKIQEKDKAIEEYKKCFNYPCTSDTKAMIMSNLGTIYIDIGRYNEGIKMYKDSLGIVESESIKDVIQNNLESELGREWLLELVTNKAICVEVGVYRGSFSRRLRERCPEHLYLIDPWEINFQIGWKVNERSSNDHVTTKEMTEFYNKLKEEYDNDKTVTIMKSTSMEAARSLGDSFKADFIYIDGGRRLEDLFSDLFVWYSKLNENGILCGRDYNSKMGKKNVIYAVNQFAKVMAVELVVFGNQYIIKKGN